MNDIILPSFFRFSVVLKRNSKGQYSGEIKVNSNDARMLLHDLKALDEALKEQYLNLNKEVG